MVIATITSGLGNQLFQYALARHLSIRCKRSLYFDKRFYRSDYAKESQRGFKLDNFNVSYLDLTKPVEYYLKATKLLKAGTLHPLVSTKSEKHYHFDPQVLNASDRLIILKGYWHSEKYFKDIAEIIRHDLQFKNIPSPEFERYKREIEAADISISIHVRRGDYVHHPEFSKTFGFIGLDYYDRSIKRMREMYPECKFFIFTDDPNWVAQNVSLGSDGIFVQNTGDSADIDDLHLMSLCDHNIIANSSFSWWGGWLNARRDKTVIAPKNWFKNQPTWDTKDLLPESWLTL